MKSFRELYDEVVSTTSYTDLIIELERLAAHVTGIDCIESEESGMLSQLSLKISSAAREMKESGDILLPKLYRNAAYLFSVSSSKSKNEDFRHDAPLLSRMWKETADFEELRLRYRWPEKLS